MIWRFVDFVLEQRAVDHRVADARVEHAIRFSACTTSGQFWQDSEMKVSNGSRRRAP
jgi:hypothetical protein